MRKKHRKGRDAPPCSDPVPDDPANVILTFNVKDRDRHDRIKARVTWDEVIINEDLSDANVVRYVVQLQSSDDGIVSEDDRIRRKVVKAKEFDEIQRITLSGFGAGDSFKLTYGGNESADSVDFAHATPSKVKSVLESISAIGDGNVSVTGNKGGPYRVWFRGDRSGQNMTAISVTSTVGCSGSVSTVQDGSGTPDCLFFNIKKRYFYRTRVKAISKNGCVGDFSAWTTYATPNDNTPPADPTGLVLDVDEHRCHITWDYPNDAGDPDLPSIDAAFFVVQLASDAGFSTILKRDRTVAQAKSFRIKKPGTATFYARVRAVDSSHNKSNWVSTNATKNSPSQPSAPNLNYVAAEGHGKDRLFAQVTIPGATMTAYQAGYDDNALVNVAFQLQISDAKNTNTFTTSNEVWTKHKNISDDLTDDPVRWKQRVQRAWYYRARTRLIDSQGKKSAWSNWSSGQKATITGTQSLSAPTGHSQRATAKGVKVFWTPPVLDGQNDEDVGFFQVQVWTGSGGTGTLLEDDTFKHGKKAQLQTDDTWPTGAVYTRVRSLDHLGNFSAWVGGTTPTTPGEVGSTPGPGSIVDLTPFASSLRPVLLWGSTALPALPNATQYPANTYMYVYASGTLTGSISGGPITGPALLKVTPAGTQWAAGVGAQSIVAGSITAGQIQAGAISANEIAANTITANKLAATMVYSGRFEITGTSGAFATAPTSTPNRIELQAAAGSADRIKFFTGAGTASLVSQNVGGVTGIQLTSGNLGFGSSAIIGTGGPAGAIQLAPLGGHPAAPSAGLYIYNVSGRLYVKNASGSQFGPY